MFSSVQNCNVNGLTDEDVGNNLPSAVLTTSFQQNAHYYANFSYLKLKKNKL